ncbi:MAG TPA: hypothetical protein VFW75_07020 [Acetobacteraceae bacterium]|nr:hypothetical protein [Acetobacteraceae bacterium]
MATRTVSAVVPSVIQSSLNSLLPAAKKTSLPSVVMRANGSNPPDSGVDDFTTCVPAGVPSVMTRPSADTKISRAEAAMVQQSGSQKWRISSHCDIVLSPV